MKRVRVRRERPTALALALALCVTMLVVYVLTLDPGSPDAVESMAAAPRVSRELEFGVLEGWCVRMAECETAQDARLAASTWVGRGAAGYVTELDGKWAVLGAVCETRQEAERVVDRLASECGVAADAVRLRSEPIRLRVTGPEAQIEAVSGADALLRRQAAQLGDMALQLDRGEIAPDAARALCALAASEASRARAALAAIPGASEDRLCAGLIEGLWALREALETLCEERYGAGTVLSGMLRCARLQCFEGQRRLYAELTGGA